VEILVILQEIIDRGRMEGRIGQGRRLEYRNGQRNIIKGENG